MSIQILPDEVASQIAAGEVVERPASVVKELLENSLDAGASQITIRIEQAGRRLIEVSDDGSGIPPAEIALALARHATSKLHFAEDLFHIVTLGFRGEALASIASVSRLTLISKTQEGSIGARLQVEGGRIGSQAQIGVPNGTVVRVEDLFYNVPARLKFLKQDLTERQQIDGLATRYALAYPAVRFQHFQDGRPVLQTSGNSKRREVLANLYGVDTARQMIEVDLEEGDSRLTGFISPVALTRSNRRELTFFVNGRWVQDISLNTALLQAYHTLLMVGRFPLAILFLELPSEEIDVNVHPAKAEVRFRSADRVFSLVQRGVRRALLAYSPIPQITNSYWKSDAPPHQVDISWEIAGQGPENTPARLTDTGPVETGAEVQPAQAASLPSGQIPLLRLVGQVGGTYIVAEGPDGLYLIDQHAAHERVLFEKLMKQHSGKIPAQALLEPAILNLPPASASLLNGQLEVLQDLGFQIEPFGPATFRIRAIPALLTGSDPVAAVRVVVEDFEEDETPLQAEIEARLAARICKRVAVKGGQTLSVEEQRTLLHDLETCKSPRTCPHGRPTMIHLSVDLLERQFGRRGSR
ncbi:MAG TPA: DNA mismatch repair endonuclease MutL [Anaerolineaceae bacterium]